jgi:CheY-like chemotaxis protein
MILIVDDQNDASLPLERLLAHAGQEAVSVTTGAEAIAVLRACKPILLVLDLHMPEVDGLTILGTIKLEESLKDIPARNHARSPLARGGGFPGQRHHRFQ